MQGRNFFIHLRFILTVFKHKYLKIGDTHEAQYIFRIFCYEGRPFNRKEKVSSFILPEILVKNAGINKIPRKNWFIIYLKTLLQNLFKFRLQVV